MDEPDKSLCGGYTAVFSIVYTSISMASNAVNNDKRYEYPEL